MPLFMFNNRKIMQVLAGVQLGRVDVGAQPERTRGPWS
jgi:hypothetical protein